MPNLKISVDLDLCSFIVLQKKIGSIEFLNLVFIDYSGLVQTSNFSCAESNAN